MTEYKMCANEEMAIYILEFIKRNYEKHLEEDSGVKKYIEALQMAIDAFNTLNCKNEMINALIAGQETLQKCIAEKTAEIEELTTDCEKYKAERDEFANHIVRIREIAQAEAIKEFAERFKKSATAVRRDVDGNCLYEVDDRFIDNLVKEMAER